MDKKKLGRFGEQRAAEYLRKKGYRILDLNYSCRVGEIDLIACNGEFLVFAEVKLRKNADFAMAREFVNSGKQRRIRTTAELWLCEHPEGELQPRFDVLEVYAPDGILGAVQINHIEDAFI